MAGADETSLHGGRLVARQLKAHGVRHLFTLSGGHLFSIFDGCRAEGIAIVDVRHEATAAFAAEGWAKTTRTPGVCALTAGPGVTNALSALAAAQAAHAPVLALGGRAPAFRWGQGSLQEIDHVPIVRPLVRYAATAGSPAEIQELVEEAWAAALRPHGGPAFVDFPLDHVFSEAPVRDLAPHPLPAARPAAGAAVERAARLLAEADRPVVMAGSDLYWGHAEGALRTLAERCGIPVFFNGLARGCLPADHPLAFSRARREALAGADLALVVGAPLDFRLGFGAVFGPDADLVVIDAVEPRREHPRAPAVELYGDLAATLAALADAVRGRPDTAAWLGALRAAEDAARAAEADALADPRAPLHPMRVYGALRTVLDRDAVIVGDGGDFVSFAGRVVDVHEPGCWLDPGPYGCLGCGPGHALAAKLAHPDRQVVLLVGDGAFGFAGMDFDTLARHGVAVVAVMGNNGAWGLEKHPMEAVYGYSVAADLRPETRYDLVVEALGGHGELVRAPDELVPALERALGAGRPALVNVITDPSVAYPRRSSLV